MSVSNVGRLADPEVVKHRFRFFPADREVSDLVREYGDANGYVTISVTRAQFGKPLLDALVQGAHHVNCGAEYLEPGVSMAETAERSVADTSEFVADAVNSIDRLMASSKDNVEVGTNAVRALARLDGGARQELRYNEYAIDRADGKVAAALSSALAAKTPSARAILSDEVGIQRLERDRLAAPILCRLDNFARNAKVARTQVDALVGTSNTKDIHEGLQKVVTGIRVGVADGQRVCAAK